MLYKEIIMNNYDDIPLLSDDIVKMLLENLSSSKLDEIKKRVKEAKRSKWKTIHIVLDLEPKPTPRPRYSSKSGVFYVKGAHSNKVFFKKYISDKDLPFITGSLEVDFRCYIKTPSSLSKIETVLAELGYIRPISKPDWDNLGKTYSDMLTDVLILDDAHVVDGRCSKYYSLHPRIEMDIKYQLKPDSKYNERKINNIKKERK